jgi:amino acid adenylation domain-containing protein
MITPAEDLQLQGSWNNTFRELPNATVHDLIEEQAVRTPDRIAIEAGGVRLTYRQLNERANRLAHRLRRAGVKPGILIALCVERTADLVIAPLAVLKAGGAYLPLDKNFPADRLAFLIEDAQAPVLLCARELAGQLPSTDAQLVCCDEADTSCENLAPAATPDTAAYVRYTSGSTGVPKGVEIHHRALVNLLRSMQREPGFTEFDSLLAVTTFSFDIAELELFLPLISGGRVVIASHDDARDLHRLIRLLRESKCSVLQATPAAWRGLIDAGWRGQPNLRAFCGGEALSRDLAEQLLPRVAELWNLYGPTETTVWSAAHKVTSGCGPVPIGHPIDNTEIYVVDAHQKLVPAGVSGELYIGGAGVARGYLRREELTAQRFVPHPFHSNQRLYRTGDLARLLPDGTLECAGRIDDQIKIRGFRIEPGEIEAALLDHEEVRAAAVRMWLDASGNHGIAAYIVSRASIEKDDLRRFLQQKLPDYMVPARLIFLDSLPLTPNGKVDRKALPEPSAIEEKVPRTAPRSDVERKLCAIWAEILDTRSIGINDDFFDLGGHSFLVAKLIRKIEMEFGRRLSMAALFAAPTIARVAELLRDTSLIGRIPRTINLQPAGTREPLFWIHGGPPFRALASKLGTNRPFLGVDFDRDEDEDFTNCSLSVFAARLVRTIRATQPHGPYHLGGWCTSGLLAYEAASLLVQEGEKVELVVVLDCVNPTHYRTIPKYQMLASKFACHVKRLLHTRISEAIVYAGQRTKGFLTHLFERPDYASPFDTALLAAAAVYDPGPISARVLVLQPVDRPEALDLRASWAELMKPGNLEVRDIPGDHLSMFAEPNVAALAKCINKRLLDNVVEMKRAIAG